MIFCSFNYQSVIFHDMHVYDVQLGQKVCPCDHTISILECTTGHNAKYIKEPNMRYFLPNRIMYSETLK